MIPDVFGVVIAAVELSPMLACGSDIGEHGISMRLGTETFGPTWALESVTKWFVFFGFKTLKKSQSQRPVVRQSVGLCRITGGDLSYLRAPLSSADLPRTFSTA